MEPTKVPKEVVPIRASPLISRPRISCTLESSTIISTSTWSIAQALEATFHLRDQLSIYLPFYIIDLHHRLQLLLLVPLCLHHHLLEDVPELALLSAYKCKGDHNQYQRDLHLSGVLAGLIIRHLYFLFITIKIGLCFHRIRYAWVARMQNVEEN